MDIVKMLTNMIPRAKTRKASGVRRATTRKHLKKIYEGMTGFGVNTSGYDPKYAVTYGEITEDGVDSLVKAFTGIQDISTYPSECRTFYDLGSGIGKNVYVVAASVPDIQSKGIELVKDRHNLAITAYNAIKDASIKQRIEFLNMSLFDRDLSDAAWIFVSNLCFVEGTNKEMAEKFAKELKPNTLVAISKSVPFPPDTFILVKKYPVPMTWDAKHEVYIYKRI